MSVLHKLKPFQNVVANDTAVLTRIDQGMSYLGILLELGGTFTKAMINELRLNLGGKTIWQISGSHLDKINAYNKITANASYLPLWFANPRAKTRAGRMVGAIDTSEGYSDFSLEVDIGAATGPTLKAWALKSAPIPEEANYKGMVRALKRAVQTPGAANTHNLDVFLGTDQGALLSAIHLFHTNVTRVDVVKDGFNLQQEGTNALVQYIQNELNRTTQAGHIAWDNLVEDDIDEAVPNLKALGGRLRRANFEFNVTTSAADNITAYSDVLARIDGL